MLLPRPCSIDATLCRSLSPILYSYIPYRVPYSLGLALQEQLVARRAQARASLRSSRSDERLHRIARTDTLLLLQHTPVYTDGRRSGSTPAEDAEVARLRGLDADYATTRRGGLVTYHGPGQLTGYPILDLGAMGLPARTYVNLLEHAVRLLVGSTPYSLPTLPSPPGGTGIWTSPSRKIASIGIQVRHRITSHGFALNVAPTALTGFQHIVACGLQGVRMVCVQQELARCARVQRSVQVDDVVPHLVAHFGDVFEREMREAPEEHLRYEADAQGVLNKVWVDGELLLVK